MDSEKFTRLLNTENFIEEIYKLSFEERLSILKKENFLTEFALERVFNTGILLFNREESLYILNNFFEIYTNSYHILDNYGSNQKLLDLQDEDFINYSLQQNYWSLLKFVKNKKKILDYLDKFDEDKRFKVFPYLDDEDLANLINQKKYRLYVDYIVRCFKSDKYKMEFINKADKSSVPYILCTLSDENMRKYITSFTAKKGLLISHLSSDEEKEKYLEQYKLILTPEDRADILFSFSNIEYIYRNIKYLNTEKSRSLFISKTIGTSFLKNNLDFCLKIVDSINSESQLYEIIPNLYDCIKDINIIKKYIDKIKNPRFIFELCKAFYDQDLEDYVLSKMTQKYICKYVKENMEYLSTYRVLLKLEDKRLFFETLRHFPFKYEYSDDMLPIFERVAKEYGLNLDHLIKLAKVSNCSILSQVTNKNIIDAINLDDENFAKYLKIFDGKSTELTNNSVSSILYSLLNSKFTIEYPGEVQIFIDTLHAIDSDDINKAIENINKVISVVDLSHFNIDPKKLTYGILNKNPEIIALYNKITYEYLVIKRNAYVNGEMSKELNQIFTPLYNINDLIKFMFNNLSEEILYRLIVSNSSYSNKEFKEILNNELLLKQLISFKKNPSKGINAELKQHLVKFNKLLSDAFSQYQYVDSLKINGLKIEYRNLSSFSKKDSLVEIMSELDVKKMTDLLFNNEKLYNELLKYLNRYSVLGWGDKFELISEDADVDMNSDIVASLINNFELIEAEKEKQEGTGKSFTFISELAFAECLNSDAAVYQNLFGRDNYRLLRRNPLPNRSPERKKVRLAKAVEFLRVMHDRKYITVPPVNKNFKLKTGKAINIIIGNTNDPINLTYGERTKSCMRIGGAGNSLFKFCLKNENGFHISFNDPETGELVSRVSCYRNGNTVFCNQVRESLSKKYSEKDIAEAATLIGKEIIELTRNSKHPVMNVVTSKSHVFENEKATNLHCKIPNLGFFPTFYTDIDNWAVVLAAREGSLSPVELGPNNCEKYEVGRSPVRKYYSDRAVDQVAHIETLDAFFGKTPLDEISVEKKDIKFAYVGEDWYIAITTSGKIINYVEKNSRNLGAAMAEMNRYLTIIEADLSYIDVDSKRKAQL